MTGTDDLEADLRRGDARAQAELRQRAERLSLAGVERGLRALLRHEGAVDPELVAALSRRLVELDPAVRAPARLVETAALPEASETAELCSARHLAVTSESGRALVDLAEEDYGDYRVVDRLGAGGMGQVFEVEHVQTQVRYALKTVLGRADSEEAARTRARFRREAELSARLDHPGVVRVHAARLEGERPYLVQDLLAGGSLEERLADGPLPEAEALRIAREVGLALQHAHERGVLHRDLKPSNVLFDEHERPVLVDFGLAISDRVGSLRLTRTGEVVGTPNFLAPEQLQGKGDAPSVDVYGLGAVLYVMLTGKNPLQLEDAPNLLVALRAVLLTPPRAPRELNPAVSHSAQRLVLGLLRKDPAKRPDLAATLAALAAPETASALEWGAAPARRRGLLTALAGALTALGLGAWILLSQGSPSVRAAELWTLRVGAPELLGERPLDQGAILRLLGELRGEEGARVEHQREVLRALARLARARAGEPVEVPEESNLDPRALAADALALLAQGARARAAERARFLGEHPRAPSGLGPALELLCAGDAAALLDGLEGDAPQAPRPLLERELLRRLSARTARAFAQPELDRELPALCARAQAAGVDLGPLAAVERRASEGAVAWLRWPPPPGASLGDWFERLGALLHAPPTTQAGPRLRGAANAALLGRARALVPSGFTSDEELLPRVLRPSGQAWIYLGAGAALNAGQLERLVFHLSREGEGLGELFSLVGGLSLLRSYRAGKFARHVPQARYRELLERYPGEPALSYLAALGASEVSAPGRSPRLSVAQVEALAAALRERGEELPEPQRVHARLLIAARLAEASRVTPGEPGRRLAERARAQARIGLELPPVLDGRLTQHLAAAEATAWRRLGDPLQEVAALERGLERLRDLAQPRPGVVVSLISRNRRVLGSALAERALVELRQGRPAQALEFALRAREDTGRDVERARQAAAVHARVLRALERWDEAWEVLEPREDEAVTDPVLFRELFEHYLRRDEPEKARALLLQLPRANGLAFARVLAEAPQLARRLR